MESIAVLSSESQDEIKGAVQRAVLLALSDPAFKGGSVSVSQLASATLECTKDGLTDALRTYNATSAPKARVPQELWDIIWTYLSMHDRIHVSQVCHDWRTAALASPRLWTAVDYRTSLHSPYCDCPSCFGTTGTTNILAVKRILSRSAKLPLSIDVQVLYWYIDPEGLSELADALTPHVDRITALSIDTEDEIAMPKLFSSFRCFPALRTLKCFSSENISTESSGFLYEDLELPALERLELHGFIDSAEHAYYPSHLPSLRTLHCIFLRTEELMHYVASAPLLSALHVQLLLTNYSLLDEPASAYELVSRAVARVQRVEVAGIVARTEALALAMFADARRAHLALSYDDADACPERGAEIFRDVPAPAELSILVDDAAEGRVAVAAAGARGGITRSIVCPASDNDSLARAVGGCVPALARLVVDVRTLVEFAPLVRACRTVPTVVLRVSATSDWAALCAADAEDARASVEVGTLRIEGACGGDLRIDVAALRDAVRFLSPARMLPTLELRGVTVEGDLRSLEDSVVTVRLGDGCGSSSPAS